MKKTHILIFTALFCSGITIAQKKEIPCPEAKMTDVAIEKEMLNAFKDDTNNNTGKEVSKAVITVRDWQVLRSELTNTPYKLITAAILYKKKDKCYSEVLDFESQFDGAEYTKSLKITGWRSAKPISCDCMNELPK